MILCNKHCLPCCDFCIHVIHEELGVTPDGSNIIIGAPIDCALHKDPEHQNIAESCGSCDDFHCFRADKETTSWISL